MAPPSSPRSGEATEPATVAVPAQTTAGSLENERWARLHALERELHDGPALRIAALSLQLGVLGQKLSEDDVRRGDIEELQTGLHTALQDLRRIADLIYPPLLHEAGLVAALRELAGRAPDRLRLQVLEETTARPPHAVEATLYFAVTDLLDRLSPTQPALEVLLAREASGVRIDAGTADPAWAAAVHEAVHRLGGRVVAGAAAERTTVTVPCG